MKIVEILVGLERKTFYSLPGKIDNPMSVQAFLSVEHTDLFAPDITFR